MSPPLSQEERARLQARFYPHAWDLLFAPIRAALQRIPRGGVILDAGSGSGSWIIRTYAPQAGLVVGVDVSFSSASQGNFVQSDLHALPLRDACVDAVVCYLVTEHLAHPAQAFREFSRVLKPGGLLIFKTPNLWSPATFLARWTPLAFHRLYKRRLGVADHDVFPTLYRCNTLGALRSALAKAGLQPHVLTCVDQTYDYLHIHPLPYILGLLYSRALQATPLRRFASQIIGVCTKPA